jgi:hypothetical protein
MIGLVYKDTVAMALTDKICTSINGAYSADVPANADMQESLLMTQSHLQSYK